jgi:hypothetical protein
MDMITIERTLAGGNFPHDAGGKISNGVASRRKPHARLEHGIG